MLPERPVCFPYFLAMLAASVGVVWFQQRAALMDWSGLVLLCGSVGFFIGWHVYVFRASVPPYRLTVWLVTVALSFAVGASYAQFRAELRLADMLAHSWMNQRVDINITIDQLPQTMGRGYGDKNVTRYDVEVEDPPPGIPHRLRLSERHLGAPLAAGSRLRVQARLYPLHGSMNPNAFDYEAWLFQHGFGATGSILARGETLPPPRFSLSRWQEKLWLRLQQAASEQGLAVADIIPVLGLGIQAQLPSEYWQTLRVSGTLHLFSISGIHVTLLAIIMGWAFQYLWRSTTVFTMRLIHFMPAWWAGRWMAVAVAWGYGALSGMGLPTQRTLLMMSILTLLLRLGWQVHWSRLALATLCIIISYDPWAVAAPGFWLSFAGVMILMSHDPSAAAKAVPLVAVASIQSKGMAWLQKGRQLLWQSVILQAKLSLILTPLLIFYFHQGSPASLLANLLAVPWVSFVMLPMALMVVIFPNATLLRWLDAQQHLFFEVMQQMSHWLPSFYTPTPHPLALILAALGAGVLMMPRGTPARWLGLPMFMPLIFLPPSPAPAWGTAAVLMLDVGAGMSVVVRTANHVLVYDTGVENDRFSAVDFTLMPWLRQNGINRLDTLLLTHADNDHAGGASRLIAHVNTEKVLWGGRVQDWQSEATAPLIATINQQRIPWQSCAQQSPWQWDGVTFTPMIASASALAPQTLSENNASCALKISAAKGEHDQPAPALLLTADLENQGLKALWQQQGEVLASDIMQLPHHGSDTSAFPEFFQAVAPKVVLLSGGPAQRHYPANNLSRTLATLTPPPKIFHTWYDGAIQFTLSAHQPLTPISIREVHRHYWHNALAENKPTTLIIPPGK